MKASELRVGNLVLCRGEVDICQGVESDVDGNAILVTEKYGNGEDDIEPIDLTEEWLLKFGFNVEKSHSTKWINEHKTFIISFKKDHWFLCDTDIDSNIQHVHQLQNLYFALTGKELTTNN